MARQVPERTASRLSVQRGLEAQRGSRWGAEDRAVLPASSHIESLDVNFVPCISQGDVNLPMGRGS